MILNNRYKFMFFAEPHTASRATAKLLRQIPGSELIGHHHMDLWYGLERKLLPTTGLLMFSTIRDPRDIIATQIAHALYNQKTVIAVDKPQESKKDIIKRYISAAITTGHFFKHAHYTDYKIRYSHLEADLVNLLHWLGVEKILELLELGVTEEKQRWFEYFDAAQMMMLLDHVPEIRQYNFDQWETR